MKKTEVWSLTLRERERERERFKSKNGRNTSPTMNYPRRKLWKKALESHAFYKMNMH